MSFIPNKNQGQYMTERQIKRKQLHLMKKLEKKYGPNLPIPTEEQVQEYINQATQWVNQQEEKQTK